MDRSLLKILACPTCKKPVSSRGAFLTCAACKKAYPVIEAVPNMLPEDAWPLEKARKARFKHSLSLL